MYICICKHQSSFGIGETLTDAFNTIREETAQTIDIEDCVFHEMNDEIPVTMKIEEK